MKILFISLCFLLFVSISIGYSQNIGIQQQNPSEPLEVGGIIFTNHGGIKFPDSTIQVTAAQNNSAANPDIQGYVMQAILVLDGVDGPYDNNNLNIFKGIPILSYNKDFTSTLITSSQGPNLGPPIFSEINLEKNADQTTVALLTKYFDQSFIPDGRIYFIRMNSANQEEIYKEIFLEDIKVLAVKQNQFYNGTTYQDTESVKLIFDKIEISVITSNGTFCVCYDFTMNTTCGC